MNILDKISEELVFESSWLPGSKEEEPKQERRFWRTRWILLDAICAVVWLYTFLRLFVGDFERWVLQATAPGYVWLVDYRFFFVLLAASMAVLFIRKKYRWLPLYLLVWPLIMAFFKIPRAVYRRGSWTIALGGIHMLFASMQGLRFTVLASTVVAFAALVITQSSLELPLGLAISALAVLWAMLLFKAASYALRPARFVRLQRRFFEKVLGEDRVFNSLFAVEGKYRSAEVERFSREDSMQIVQRAGFGLVAYRGVQLWASKLDAYRRSGASIVFGAASILGLILQGLLTFTLVNLAVYKIDPSQYDVRGSNDGLFMFAYYSFASLFVSEVSVIVPTGPVAAVTSITAGLSLAVFVFILVATVFFGFKQTRDDQTAIEEIRQMREHGERFAARLGKEYEVSVEQMIAKLESLGWDMLGILAQMSSGVPEPPINGGASRGEP